MILANIGMIATGLFAALDPHLRNRWGFYAFSCIFFLYVLFTLLWIGRKTSNLRSERVGKAFLGLSIYTVILWTAYPIVWALAEGSNYMTSDSEVICYAVLDILAKPIFGAALLIAQSTISEAGVSLSAFWTEPIGSNHDYGAIPQRD